MTPLEENLRVFLGGLRLLGFDVTMDDWRLAVIALASVDWRDEIAVEHALQALWCRSRQQVSLFSAAFRIWRDLLRRPEHLPAVAHETYLAQIARRRRQENLTAAPPWLMTPHRRAASAPTESLDQPLLFARGASRAERMAYQRLDRLSDEEMAALLAWYRPRRPLSVPSYLPKASVRGRDWNPNETIRRGRAGSEWVALYFDKPRLEPMPVTILLDMSGSMAGYHRPLLQFAHAMLRHERRLTVYAFSTRLTEVTRALRLMHVDQALAEVSALTPDRGGGTRLAESLERLWRHHRGHGVGSRSRLVLVTDGMEAAGEPLALWLSRWQAFLHGRLWWWNPFHTDWRRIETRSLQLLARHSQMAEVSTFEQLNQAWENLDGGRK